MRRMLTMTLALSLLSTGCKDDKQKTAVLLSSTIPFDVVIADTSAPAQGEFDVFSWQTFVALAWPAGADGQPSTDQIGAAGDAISVMERWSSTADLINAPQATFGTAYVPSRCDSVYQPGMLVLGQAAKKSAAFQDEILEASGEPLVDLQGEFTRYTISINKSMFDTIEQGGWYTAAGQDGAALSFECGSQAAASVGALEVKAAWKVMSSTEASSGRFHTRDAAVYVPAAQTETGTATCSLMTVGLVGLHVVHKTTQQQAWVWSTFEHVDNVPDCDGQDAPGFSCPTNPGEGPYSYFATACPDSDPGCTACNTAAAHNSIDGTKYVVDEPAERGLVCRPSSISADTVTLNAQYQAALAAVNPASVWQNYMLVSTQWNTQITTDGSCASIVDTFDKAKNAPQDAEGNPLPVGNTSMETYDWKSNTGTGAEWVNPSCINCHKFAQGVGTPAANADFVYFLGLEVE